MTPSEAALSQLFKDMVGHKDIIYDFDWGWKPVPRKKAPAGLLARRMQAVRPRSYDPPDVTRTCEDGVTFTFKVAGQGGLLLGLS